MALSLFIKEKEPFHTQKIETPPLMFEDAMQKVVSYHLQLLVLELAFKLL